MCYVATHKSDTKCPGHFGQAWHNKIIVTVHIRQFQFIVTMTLRKQYHKLDLFIRQKFKTFKLARILFLLLHYSVCMVKLIKLKHLYIVQFLIKWQIYTLKVVYSHLPTKNTVYADFNVL